MALSDITREDVLASITEFSAQGRQAFLDAYGFGPTDEHVVLHEGGVYDAPAIAGAAHGFARPEFGPLTPLSLPAVAEITGHLADLGFEVRSTHRSPAVSPQRGRDVRRWRSTYELVRIAADNDAATQGIWRQVDGLRPDRVREIREVLRELAMSRDVHAFVDAVSVWSRRPGPYAALAGFGPTWLGQLLKVTAGRERDLADLLVDVTQTPDGDEAAATKIRALEEFAGDGDLDSSRIPTILSVFWTTDEHADWPVLWPAGAEAFQTLGWMGRHLTYPERYVAFAELCRAFEPDDPRHAERVVGYLGTREPFVGLGNSLPDICEEASEHIAHHRPGVGYPSAEDETRAAGLARQLRGVATLMVRSLHAPLQDATGLRLHETNLQTRVGQSTNTAYRADAHATWTLPGGTGAPGFRVWVTRSGVAVGLHSGWDGQGNVERHEQIGRNVERHLPSGMTFFTLRPTTNGDRVHPADRSYPGGEVFVGRWWPHPEALGRADFKGDILETVTALQPLVEVMAGKEPTPRGPVDVDLLAQLERFVAERPYPSERDTWHGEQRRALAQSLEPSSLDAFDLAAFRRLMNGRAYGHPGTHSVLQAALAKVDAAGLDAFAQSIKRLLWGDGDEVVRIEEAVAGGQVPGLGEPIVMKLLAVAHPGRHLPIYHLGGPDGKIALARALGVELPDPASMSRARMHVVAGDRIRARLEPLLPGDPWGQVQFAMWLLRKGESVADPERDLIAEAAGQLLVDEDFLREIHGLLEDKKQVIFYGPPGTGKTYLAQRLAAALQPDATKRQVVQFHPSTSYEDFFEGFRPRLDVDGQMVYELRKGPLALLAEAAEADPTTPHIMLIDEINRANLPRVFGELLYLLEYRSQSVMTSYRPDEGFELPPNLYFIGTMNTADRSIALVDAALRRRFHFVPFMPHEGPMEGLLHRWLTAHDEPVWVAGVVDRVNEELRRALRGPHLQIGHSHFMVHGLNDAVLQRIWTYSVYPFIEDQFYGREDVLRSFTWQSVVERHGPSAQAEAGQVPPAALHT